jgi:predicted transcriptional regulator
MVAPNYAAARSALAKSSGLGQSRAAAKRGKTKLAAS